MIDPVSMAKLKTVHPALCAAVLLVERDYELARPGDTLVAAECFRTWGEQEDLWLKGRDEEGNVIDAGAIVTNAPPGHSWHEFGMAVDMVPESLLNTPGWAPQSPLWPLITKIAQARGLACGACWVHKDLPHLQLTGKFGVSPDDSVRALFLQEGGINAVWKASGLPLL
jgi:peptidoglycan L-alanyl-D-glutamate endopeptidase CwlK